MKEKLYILFLLFSISLFSQTSELVGNVKYTEDNSPMAGLNIEMIKNGKTIRLVTVDVNGDFYIKDIEIGLYDLQMTFLGMRNKIIPDIEIIEGKNNLNLSYPDPCIDSKKLCPKNHSDNLVPIVYGLPGKKLMRQHKRGKVKLGGCILLGCDPKWYCQKHNLEF